MVRSTCTATIGRQNICLAHPDPIISFSFWYEGDPTPPESQSDPLDVGAMLQAPPSFGTAPGCSRAPHCRLRRHLPQRYRSILAHLLLVPARPCTQKRYPILGILCPNVYFRENIIAHENSCTLYFPSFPLVHAFRPIGYGDGRCI